MCYPTACCMNDLFLEMESSEGENIHVHLHSSVFSSHTWRKLLLCIPKKWTQTVKYRSLDTPHLVLTYCTKYLWQAFEELKRFRSGFFPSMLRARANIFINISNGSKSRIVPKRKYLWMKICSGDLATISQIVPMYWIQHSRVQIESRKNKFPHSRL